jgi:hypothetical protein
LSGHFARFDRAPCPDRDQNSDHPFGSHRFHHSHGPTARSQADAEFLSWTTNPAGVNFRNHHIELDLRRQIDGPQSWSGFGIETVETCRTTVISIGTNAWNAYPDIDELEKKAN